MTQKIGFTPDGGLAIRIVNGTGAPSIRGTVVAASPSADNKVHLQDDEFDSVGVVYESGVADGDEMWVVVSGMAYIMLKDGEACTREFLAIASATTGRFEAIAVPSVSPVVAEHFKEIGHTLESVAGGTSVLVKCIIHFN